MAIAKVFKFGPTIVPNGFAAGHVARQWMCHGHGRVKRAVLVKGSCLLLPMSGLLIR